MPEAASHAVPQSGDGDKYVVVARRYRPRSFDELVGQGHVGQALKNAIETHRVGHAYLFTGARGVGKTSTARIFAKALNAPEGPTANPDNSSDICQAIDAGEDVDVLEIDGASNRGIDEIRSLRAGVGIRPSRARYKIYIIDEVHMLTSAAFNALLKTLEEPPEHVKFIFCTTDPEKLPITVLSRCQRFDFAPVQPDEIVKRLREIIDAEQAEADDEALRLLARRAAGSMRDSQSLLEQVLSFSSGRLTVDAVHRMLGTADDARLSAMTAALVQRDAKSALEQADAAITAGVDAGQFAEQLLGHFRDLLTATVGCDPEMLRHSNESLHGEFRQLGEQWGLSTVLAIVGLLDQTLVRIRQSVHGRVLLEAALVQICQLPDMQRIADLVAGLSSAKRGSGGAQKKKLDPHPINDPSPQAASGRSARPTIPEAVKQAAANLPPSGPSSDEAPALAANSGSIEGRTPHGSGGGSSQSSYPPEGMPNGHGLDSGPSVLQPGADGSQASQHSAAPPSGGRGESEGSGAVGLLEKSLSVEWTQRGVERLWGVATSGLDDMTADLARQASRVEMLDEGKLRVYFPKNCTLTKTSCEKPERKSKLERALKSVAARHVLLEFAFDKRASVSKSVEAPAASAGERKQRQRALKTHPFVQQCVELFDAEVMKVEAIRE